MKIFGYDIKVVKNAVAVTERSQGIEYYSANRERLVFSRSELLDAERMISDRLHNLVWSTRVDYLLSKKIITFIEENYLQIIQRLFNDGYVIIDYKALTFPNIAGRNVFNKKDGKVFFNLRPDEFAYASETFRSTGYSDRYFIEDKIRFLDAVNSSDFNLIENYGAMGIVSPETDSSYTGAEFTAKDIEEMQANYSKHYGIKFGKWSLMFVPHPTKYNKIDLPIAQLQLSEKRLYAIKSIYSALGIPKELSVYFENSTYANREQAELDFYNSTVKKWAELLLDLVQYLWRYSSFGQNYEKQEFWYEFKDVAVLQSYKQKEKETARLEFEFWQKVKAEMPQYTDTANSRLDDLIENL